MKIKQINNIIIYKRFDKFACVHNKITYEEFDTLETAESWCKEITQFIKNNIYKHE